jgi:DNA repair ATPase RecN
MLSEEDKQWIAQTVAQTIAQTVAASERNLMNVIESLRREADSRFDSVEISLDRIETRLAKQGGLINGGARQITRLIEWSENIDRMMVERDETIEELKRRIAKLEGPA